MSENLVGDRGELAGSEGMPRAENIAYAAKPLKMGAPCDRALTWRRIATSLDRTILSALEAQEFDP